MSSALILTLIGLLVVIFSQFGGKLSATSAWQWWLVGIFVVIGAFQPEIYRPFAELLGIRFISNFVLAALVMFLFMQGLSSQASTIDLLRKHRQFVSAEAVKRYLSLNPKTMTPRVLVILPTYNEHETIENMAVQLANLKELNPAIHYCFVNDGSTDGTNEALKKIGAEYYLEHLTNINVSGVLRSGFNLAQELNAEFVVQCDADGQHPVSKISSLVKEAEDQGADCLIGSRFAGCGFSERFQNGSTSVLRVLGGQSLCWALRGLFGARVTDPTSGFRVYSRAAIQVLRERMPDDYPEPESIAVLAECGLKIAEMPVKMSPRTTGTSSLSGIRSITYMSKVVSALLGLRMRTLLVK